MATLPAEAYLNRIYAEEKIMENLEPYLPFNEILKPIDISQSVFNYKKREMTISEDITNAVMSEPTPVGEKTQFNNIEISNISQEDGRSYRLGYQMKFTRDDLLQQDTAKSELDYGYQALGYGIALATTKMILGGLTTGTADTYSPSITWGSDTGKQNPLQDLRKAYFAHKDPSRPQRITDYYLNTTNVQEMLDYCDSLDIEYADDTPDVYTINKNPVRKFKIHDVESFITEGHYLGLDTRPQTYIGADLYRTIDPKFTVQKANPDQSGDQTSLHIMVHDDNDTLETVVKAWLQMGIAVKEPKAIQYGSGI
jgi:hypothetical protein